eukprot:1795447-Rhodomonas_salina.3
MAICMHHDIDCIPASMRNFLAFFFCETDTLASLAASADIVKCFEDSQKQEYIDCVAEAAKLPTTTATEYCDYMKAQGSCTPGSCCEGDLGKLQEDSANDSFKLLYPDDTCDIKCGAMNLQASIAFVLIALAAAAKNVF